MVCFVRRYNKSIIYSVVLSIVINTICYLLSSRELVYDLKNVVIVLALSMLGVFLADRFYKTEKVICIMSFYMALAFIMPYIAYLTEPMYLTRLMKDFLSVYTIGVLMIITPLINAKFDDKIVCFVNGCLSCIVLLPTVFVAGYYYIANAKPSSDTIVAVLQTDKQEAIEFLNSYLSSIDYVLLATLIIGLFLFGYFFTIKLLADLRKLPANGFIFACLFCLLLLSDALFFQKTYMFRSYQNAKDAIKTLEKFKEYENQRMVLFSSNGIVSSKWGGNYALVIGETHTKSHMSVAGYSRDTTPWLSKMLKDNQAIILDNGYSCAAQTEPALRYALTQKNQYNSIKYEQSLTIVEMAKLAGFKVVWVTNQTNDTIAGLICGQADESIWLNQSKNDTYMRQKNGIDDSLVLKHFENRKVREQKTLYIIHLLGSHADYECRYPEQFNKWDEQLGKVNSYDNSILFNDYVMSKLTRKLFDNLKVDALMYFADHGEELDKFFCHGTDFYLNNIKKNAAVKDIARIPVYFVFNDIYKLQHDDVIGSLKANQNKYFTNDMVFETFFGLMGVESNYIDKRFDLTSPQYQMELENMSTAWGKVRLQDTL